MKEQFQSHEIRDKIVINYKYSLGGQSKFFIELKENKRILGTKCKKCGKVWVPPRIACSNCYEDTEWLEMPHNATIKVSTIVWYTTSAFIQSVPYGVAFVQIDKADTALLQGIFSENLVPSKLKKGQRIKAVFKKKEDREGKMTDFFFVPEDEYERWITKPEYEGGE